MKILTRLQRVADLTVSDALITEVSSVEELVSELQELIVDLREDNNKFRVYEIVEGK